MQPSTDIFQLELSSGARLAYRCVITQADRILEDTFYGGDSVVMMSQGGDVQYDRTGDTRATANFNFLLRRSSAEYMLDPTLFPEVLSYAGVWTGSDYEWIQLGVFGIHSTNFDRRGESVTATSQATDRSAKLRDNPWSAPFQIAAGLDYYAAIKAVVDNRAKGFTPLYNISSNALTTPTLNYADGEDPWGVVIKLAEAVGAEAYFDRQGCVAAFPVPDPLVTAPNIVLSGDRAESILITPVSRETSIREFFNGVICRGEASWLLFPVSGEVWESNPLSPGYRATFGDKPKIIGDALATTDAQCLAAAQAEYNKIGGVIEKIDFTTLKDPRIEVGDIVDQQDDALGVYGRYVLDSYTFPLGAGPASGLVRRKR
jgi:hypothetical protein